MMHQTGSQKAASRLLNLNVWGKISITIFSDSAIEYAIKELKNNNTIRNKYKFFVFSAKQYCIKNQIPLNYQKCYELQKEHNMPDDVEVFVDPISDKLEVAILTSHNDKQVDHNIECKKWHDIIANLDRIDDPKKKPAPGYNFPYVGYNDWLENK